MKPIFILMACTLLITACGGGGSSSSPATTEQPSNGASAPPTMPTTPTTPTMPTTPPSAENTVTYRVTFSTIWTEAQFPTQYPSGRHFSPLVGMTHNEQATLWIDAGLATEGMESMAETGGRLSLNTEINAFIEQGYAQFLLNGGGISSLTDSIEFEFEVSEAFSLVTLVSMVAPSPDWFVGVNSVDLRDENGEWRSRVNMGLRILDAGTDSGLSYNSGNSDTQPREPIQLLTSDASDTDIQAGIHRDSGKNIANFSFELL